MRRGALYLVALITLFTLTATQGQEPRGAAIEFGESVIDLGTLSQDDDKQYLRIVATYLWSSPRYAQAVHVPP